MTFFKAIFRVYRRRCSFQLGVNFEVNKHIIDLEIQIIFWGILFRIPLYQIRAKMKEEKQRKTKCA